MTPQGYRNRLACIEWHVNFWLQSGTDYDQCQRTLHHLQECLDADFYGEARPEAPDSITLVLIDYLDREFSGPTVERDGWGALVSFE